MADVKFPNISQSNNNSFVADRPSNNLNGVGGALGDYGEGQGQRNGNDGRS
jgi:hypothetical protein